ncbi:DUF4238 domain-containing protein [Desulfosporosinus sp. SB140]|uniref:DUF4238 domain-containing protein n=1 Tax=Desulfosporosinus paludis TaxID=3115649 RepID=UPI00389071D0
MKKNKDKKDKHHYISQCYLEFFTDPLTPPLHTPYVWILDKKNESITNKAPNNFAFIKGYNDIYDKDGNKSDIVEKQFGKIEGEAKNVLRKIKQLKYISKTERYLLSEFVFSMMLRVPKFRDTFRKLVMEGYINELSDGKFKDIEISSEISMDSVIRTTHVASQLLQGMAWSLLIAPDHSHFITSDNPVVVRIPDDPNWLFIGFGHAGAQITFPLNPKMCLFGEWERSRKIIEKVDADEVNDINFETYKYSDKFVYSNSKYFMKEILLVNHLVNKGLIN